MSRRDGVLALGYYVYLMMITFLFGYIMFRTMLLYEASKYIPNDQLLRITVDMLMSLLQLLPLFFILWLRGQPLSSVGFMKRKLIRSIGIGCVAAIPFLVKPIYSLLNGSTSFKLSFWGILIQLFYNLVLIALVEEILFRGYIQSRLLDLVNHKMIALFIGSLMFSILHIPFQMFRHGMGLLEFLAYDWPHLLFAGFMHLFFAFIYSLTKNIAAPTVVHGLLDFFGR